MKIYLHILLWGLMFFMWGCSSTEKIPLGEIYKEAAKNENRNPVVLIHGITGARLIQKDTEKIVWGAFSNAGINLNSEEGTRALAMPIWQTKNDFQPQDVPKIQDDIYASGPLDKLDLSIFGFSFSVDIYISIIKTLGIGGYRDSVTSDVVDYGPDHYTCFTFFYDWRKDNIANAILFGKYLEDMAKYVQQKDQERGFQRGEVKFDVVAHSMGGLVARYYLMYGGEDVTQQQKPVVTWAGAKRIARLIQVGTPNTGSLNSLAALTQGQEFAIVLPKFQASLLATFPSLYQLLPRPRHKVFIDEQNQPIDLDIYDVEQWKANKWGIFSDEQVTYVKWLCKDQSNPYQTVEAYVKCVLLRAKSFHEAMDSVATTPCPAQIYLFASKSIPTVSKVKLVAARNGKGLLFHSQDLVTPGDGSVTMANALGDERQGKPWTPFVKSNIPFSAIYLLNEEHLKMTTTRRFQNNLLHLLLETPALNIPSR